MLNVFQEILTSMLPCPNACSMHYIAFHSYTFFGFMRNEFEGTEVSTMTVGVT